MLSLLLYYEVMKQTLLSKSVLSLRMVKCVVVSVSLQYCSAGYDP